MEPPYILNVDDNEAMRRPSSPLWHAGKSFDSLGALGIDPSKEAFKVLDRASRLRP